MSEARAARGLALAMTGLAVALSGCQLGPGRLRVSSAHYSDAVRVASSEQLLVNLVRLRYRDLPVFLSVSNISTQFELDASLAAAGEVGLPGSDSAGVGADVGYAERPTISFSIRGGEIFQRRMLQPVSVPAVGLLAHSGWRAERVLRLLVEEMNGLKNAPTASGPTPRRAPEYRTFLDAAALLQRLVDGRAVRFELVDRTESLSDPAPADQIEGLARLAAARPDAELRRTADGLYHVVATERQLWLHFAPASRGDAEATRLRDLLQLAPGPDRFRVEATEAVGFDSFAPPGPREKIAVEMRSLMGVLFYLSNGVEAPPADVAAGRVTTTVDASDAPFEWAALLGDLFRVRGGTDEPDGAAVAVEHRGRWFHLADDDESSKSTFLLLEQLFTLVTGEVGGSAPVLTLPVGG